MERALQYAFSSFPSPLFFFFFLMELVFKLTAYFGAGDLMNYLPGLALNHNPPSLSLPNS
jgi:hypothetical protein